MFVEIFGLNLKNDENILLSLIKVGTRKKVKIDYFYKNQSDIEDFRAAINLLDDKSDAFAKIVNEIVYDEKTNKIILKFHSEFTSYKSNIFIENIYCSIDGGEVEINFYPAEEHFLYIGMKRWNIK